MPGPLHMLSPVLGVLYASPTLFSWLVLQTGALILLRKSSLTACSSFHLGWVFRAPPLGPSSHSHPLPLPLSGPLIFLGPIDSTSVYLSWNLSSPLYSHCPCLRSSAKVEQWLKAQVQSQPQVRIPHLPLTSW